MWKIKACYLLLAMSSGCLDPHLPVLLTGYGMATSTLGVLSGVRTLASIFFNIVISSYADRTGKHRLVAKVCTYATALSSVLLYFATVAAPSFSANQCALGVVFGVPLLLITVARSPLGSLESDAIMTHLTARGRKEEFGRVRLFGALGFGLSNSAVGFFVRQGEVKYISLLFAAAMAVSGFFSDTFFVDKKKKKKQQQQQKAGGGEAAGVVGSLRAMFGEKGFATFAVVLVVMGYTHCVFSKYVALFINTDPRTSTEVFAWSGLAAMAGELPFFFFSDALLRRFGAAAVILAAQVGTAVRLAGYGMLRGNALIAPQLLHGVTFSLMWASSVIYVDGLAPPHLSATAQSVLSILYGGVSAFVSSLVNGYLFEIGGKALVVWSSVALVAVSAAVWLATADFKTLPQPQKSSKKKRY